MAANSNIDNEAEGNNNLQSRVENISIGEESKTEPVNEFKNELTQTDHLNKKLLTAFMNRVDTLQIHQNTASRKQVEEDTKDDFEDHSSSEK